MDSPFALDLKSTHFVDKNEYVPPHHFECRFQIEGLGKISVFKQDAILIGGKQKNLYFSPVRQRMIKNQ